MTDPFEYPDEVLYELSSPDLDMEGEDYARFTEDEDYFHGKGKDKSVSMNTIFVESFKKKSKQKVELPSKYTEDYWIRAYSKKQKSGTKFGGKWLLFVPKKHIDAAWEQVKDATERNLLGPESKVSTKLGEQGDDYVICVFTKNWKNEEDVMRVRKVLRDLGFEKPIPYKTNEDTRARKYAKDGHKGIAKYYE